MTGELADTGLADALSGLVPLCQFEVAKWTEDQRTEFCREAGAVIACQGDTLQFGSGSRRRDNGARRLREHLQRAGRHQKCAEPGCWCNKTGQPEYSRAELLTMLARALACAAYQPGGITVAGSHWCTDHAACEAAKTAARGGAPGKIPPAFRRPGRASSQGSDAGPAGNLRRTSFPPAPGRQTRGPRPR